MSKFIDDEVKLTYDDVLLYPGETSIKSRMSVTTRTSLSEYMHLEVPIMSAAMDTVTNGIMAKALSQAGGMGIIHRFQGVEERVKQVDGVEKVGIAVGMTETKADIENIAEACDVIALDVANAYSSEVLRRTEELASWVKYHNILMVGNVVAHEAVQSLCWAGANIVKIGIGGGAACTTREVTGFGYPNVSAILECAEAADKMHSEVVLVADGGLRSSSDIAKALAAGADCVMLGSMLAGCDQAPGQFVPGKGKVYRGMASNDAQVDWRGGLKAGTVAEGVSGYIPRTGSVGDQVESLVGGLRSAMSYAGAKNLKEFKEKAKFVRVTSNCLRENKSRI